MRAWRFAVFFVAGVAAQNRQIARFAEMSEAERIGYCAGALMAFGPDGGVARGAISK